MKTNWKALLAIAMVSSLVGCSDGLTDEESAQGFAAANLVLQQGGSAAQANALVSLDHTFNCLEGGSASFTGEYDDEAAATGDAEFKYSVSFNGCVSQGVTIDGSMTYDLKTTTTETSTSLKYSYVGNLGFSGEVDGDCEMDLTGSVETSSAGGSGTFSYSYSGSICGNDASSLNGSGSY